MALASVVMSCIGEEGEREGAVPEERWSEEEVGGLAVLRGEVKEDHTRDAISAKLSPALREALAAVAASEESSTVFPGVDRSEERPVDPGGWRCLGLLPS